jgi:hypothetical protein
MAILKHKMAVLKHKIAILRHKSPPINYYTLQQSPRVTAAAGQLVFFEKSCILGKTQATIQNAQFIYNENQLLKNW